MKINKLIAKEGNIDILNDTFSANSNLIYSKKNTRGKSTYLRLLFHSLGFQVPAMKGLDYADVEVEIDISVKGKNYIIQRDSYLLKCTNTATSEIFFFHLPSEHVSFLSFILEYENIKVLKNILGIIYVDQEKGWTLLNRGKVIGSVQFSIEELIAGLNNINCDDLLIEKSKIEKEIAKYKTAVSIADLKAQIQENLDEISVSEIEEVLNSKLMLASLKISDAKKAIKEIDAIIQKEERFFDYIDSMELEVSNGQTTIPVNRDTLKYNYSVDLFKARKSILTTELYKYEKEYSIVKSQLEKYLLDHNIITSLSGETQDTQINRQLVNFSVDAKTVQPLLDAAQKRLKIVRNEIKTKLKHNNDYISKVYKYVYEFAKKLKIDDKMILKEDFIFTNDIKSMSGAILQKMVFCFKAAFLKVLEESIGTNLFIVLDSPRGKELDDENTSELFKVISEDLKNTQIFIASIYEFKCDNKIELMERAIEDRTKKDEK